MNTLARWPRMAVLMLLLALGACSGDDDGVPPGPAQGLPGDTIGSSGGTVTGTSGAQVRIPANALTVPTAIAIAASSSGAPPLPSGVTAHGPMFAFTPHGTTFNAPVTVTLPFDPSGVPPGATPALYKTNSANAWEPVNTALFAGAQVSADVTGFSFFQVVIPPLVRNDPVRDWAFTVYPGNGGAPVLIEKGTQVGDTLDEIAAFGPTVLDATIVGLTETFPPDEIANGQVFGSPDGVTYGVFAESPNGRLGTSEPIGSETFLEQRQSYIKRADDATLRFTVTFVDIVAADFKARLLTGPAPLVGEAHLLVSAYRNDGVDFFNTGGEASVFGARDFLFREVSNDATAMRPLWAEDDFEFQTGPTVLDTGGISCEGSGARLQLRRPKTINVDLSSLALGEEFTLRAQARTKTMNRRGGGTTADCQAAYVNAYLRDPAEIGGTTITLSGLEPTNRPSDPVPQPPSQPRACSSQPTPAAGTLQFTADTYAVDETVVAAPAIRVSRTGGSTGAVSVSLSTSDGTALAGSDYTPLTTTVLFADGEAGSRTVRVPIATDLLVEGNETFQVSLSDLGGCATLGARSTAVVSIVDDSDIIPSLPSRTVGGTVSGLLGSSLTLRDSNASVLTPSNGAFVFPIPIPHGLRYSVSIQTQPTNPTQTCSVTNGSGVIDAADVTNVEVRCVTPPPTGGLDPTFGSAGKVTNGAAAVALALQSDGKSLVLSRRTLARFNIDGTPDATFGAGGSSAVVFEGAAQDEAQGLAVQPDGRIVVVGYTRTATLDDFGIVRFNADGTPDSGFGTGGRTHIDFNGLTDRAVAALIQADGSIVVAGHASRPDPRGGDADFAVVRLTPNGAPDATFGTAGRTTTEIGGRADFAADAVLQPDGKIVLAGRVGIDGGATPDFSVVRYNANGTPDAGFASQGILRTAVAGLNSDEANDVALQPDGTIVVSGFMQRTQPSRFNFAFIRVSAGGGVISQTTTEVTSQDDFGRAVAVQADGKIVVAGQSSNRQSPDFAVARYNADGTPDTTFDGDGRLTIDFFGGGDDARDVLIQSDGKIVVAGEALNGSTVSLGMVRIDP